MMIMMKHYYFKILSELFFILFFIYTYFLFSTVLIRNIVLKNINSFAIKNLIKIRNIKNKISQKTKFIN